MPYVNARDGVKLHYELHDYTDPWKRAPILMLQHGYGRSGRYWYNMIPYLSRFYRVVCPDLRGLGRSSTDFDLDTGLSGDHYLNDMLSIADSLDAETFHYAGESLAGMLGLALAAKHAKRLRTLTLMSTSLSIRPDVQQTFAHGYASWEEALRKMGGKAFSDAQNTWRFPPDVDPDLANWYSEEFAKSDVDVLIATSKVGAKLDLTPMLKDIAVPILGLYPTGGKFAKSGQEAILRKGLPHMNMIHLPVPYHMVWVMAPATCAKHMLHFISMHDGFACHEK